MSNRNEASRQSTATEDSPRLLIDTTLAFIHTALPDGAIDFLNQGWLEYVGLHQTGLLGWRWTTVIHPEDVEEFVDKWRAAHNKRPHPALGVQITVRPAAGARASFTAAGRRRGCCRRWS